MRTRARVIFLCFVASIAGAGCGDDGQAGGGVRGLRGHVQKGPFSSGSQVDVVAIGAAFAPTGTTFNTETDDDFGSYDLGAVTLDSPYVEVVTSGYFYNEVAGALSSGPLTLRVFDTTVGAGGANETASATLNSNILTTIARERIKYLVDPAHGGLAFVDAQRQAQTEILRIFHVPEEDLAEVTRFSEMDISQEGTPNAILLAVSATVLGNLSVAELSEMLSKVTNDVASDGHLDNAVYVAQLTQNAQTLDLAAIRTNLQARYAFLGHAELPIPPFEDFVDSDGDGVVNKYDYTLLGPDGVVTNTLPTLRWTPSRLPGVTYRVQVARDPEFTDVVEDAGGLATANFTLTHALADDVLYNWRVLVSGTNQTEVDWAGPSQVRVQLGGVDGLDGFTRTQAGVAITHDVQPTFTWSANANAASYRFVLSLASDLAQPLVDTTVGAPPYTQATALAATPHTDYYWAVTPIDANGVAGTRSGVSHFILDTVAPAGTLVIEAGAAVTDHTDVTLALTANDADEVPFVQIARANDFATAAATPMAATMTYALTGAAPNSAVDVWARFVDSAGNPSEPVHATIFFRPPSTLTADDESVPRGQAFGSALAWAGDQLLVGAAGVGMGAPQPGSPGVVRVLDPNTGALVHRLTLEAGQGYGFGFRVAAEGTNAVITRWDRWNPNLPGSAYVYDLVDFHQVAALTPSAGASVGYGKSIAVGTTTAFVGAPAATGGGAVYRFALADGSELAPLVRATPETGADLGRAIAVLGTNVVVGAPASGGGDSPQGAAYVFSAESGAELRRLVTTDGAEVGLGTAVAVSETVAVVSSGVASDKLQSNAFASEPRPGVVYIFDLATGAELRRIEGVPGEYFGCEQGLAVSGNLLAVGAPGVFGPSSSSGMFGAVYVYAVDSGALLYTLHAPTEGANNAFGYAVALVGAKFAVGAPYRDGELVDQGAAYLFDRSPP